METISKAELARELGISRVRVNQYCTKGMPTRSDGKLDRERALKWISGAIIPSDRETDKGTVRAARLLKGETAQPECPGWLRPARDCENPFDRGVLFATLSFVRDIGAIAAMAARDAGATIEAARTVEQIMPTMFVEIAGDLMRRNGVGPFEGDDDPPIWPREKGMRVDWKRVAEDAGERYEPKKWDAYAKKRKSALARECEGIEGSEEAEAARDKKGGARKANSISK